MKRFVLAAALLFPATPAIFSQPVDFLPLAEVKPGLKGIGRTVFEGTEIETFEVEILGVLENFSSQQNLILARLDGEKVRKTGVFAGMSGSPVFIDGRLIGAVAYSFSFSKEPIAGITPIQEMIDIFREKSRTIAPPRIQSSLAPPSGLYQAQAGIFFPPPPSLTASIPVEGGLWGQPLELTPIATPLSLTGATPATLQWFGPQLRALGLEPRLSGGMARPGDFPDSPLEPGSTVTVQLIQGDFQASAAGTVTYVDGKRVYGFGHPFMGTGFTDMPMSKGAVLTVISSLATSQKITATGAKVGSLRQDRATGVLGIVGEESRLVPIEVRLLTSRKEERTFRYEVITDTLLTPFLTTLVVFNSLSASERTLGSQTLQVRCKILLKDQPEVRFENGVSDLANTTTFAALAAAAPVNYLLSSGFEDVQLEKVEIEISAVEQTRTAVLDKIWLDRAEVSPGEEVELTLFLRKPNGETLVEKYPVKIPEQVPPGPLELLVSEGQALSRSDSESEPSQFVPRNVQQLIRAINNLKKNNRLYIRLFRNKPGAVVAGEGLPDLPPSMLELYNSARTAGTAKPFERVIYVEHELPPTEFVLEGQKNVKLRIKG